MKNILDQLVLLLAKINDHHLQFVMMLVALVMFVFGGHLHLLPNSEPGSTGG